MKLRSTRFKSFKKKEKMDSYSPIRSRTGFMGVTYGEVEVTEGLKLTIFTYKWGKCVRIVEKSPLESLIL
jgi:hypothetical protein